LPTVSTRARRLILSLVVVGTLGGAFVLWPSPPGPPYAAARAVVDRHCLGCHSEHPSIPAFPLPPKDVKLDTAEEMRTHAALIRKTVIETRTMPLVNKTEMTEEERALLAAWVQAGARLR
jgi:uncharacterized membrane protein